jgi:hypothetical protein
MSHTWKFLPIAALFALGAFMLLPGGATQPTSVSAALTDCDDDDNLTGRIIVTVTDNDTGDPLEIAGAEIEISPDPLDGSGSPEFVDNEDPDDDNDTGVIELEDVCVDDGVAPAATFDVAIQSLPGPADECELVEDEATADFPAASETVNVELEIDCDDVDLSLTPTASATSGAGAAATVNVSSSNNNLGCGATSIVTITVLDGDGDPVNAGTLVNIVADKGSVSPASGQTTADGSVFVFYTAPNNQGGEATITASSGSALGSAEIDINCNTQPTQAPPPTQPVGGIQPPNTGDGGLSDGGNTWQNYAGVALILSSVIATLATIRRHA